MDRWLLVLCDYKQICRGATCLIAFAADRLAFDTRNLSQVALDSIDERRVEY
jgi:hypothetical protein